MGNKRIRLEIKLLNRDKLLVLEGDMSEFNNDECIQQQLNNTCRDIISFGEIGVRRELIEWYAFTNCDKNGK